jgi:hypothetical protein
MKLYILTLRNQPIFVSDKEATTKEKAERLATVLYGKFKTQGDISLNYFPAESHPGSISEFRLIMIGLDDDLIFSRELAYLEDAKKRKRFLSDG